MMLIEKTNKNKKGFSLVELLAVLGVGGAMVAGALTLVSNVQTKREIKLHSENISTMFNNMQNLFANEDVVVDTETLITAGVFPNQLNINSSGDGVKSPSGGLVEFTAPTGEGYILTYEGVGADACVEVIKAQRDVGWDSFSVTGTGAAGGGSDFIVATVTSIAAVCKSTGDWVDLTFTLD